MALKVELELGGLGLGWTDVSGDLSLVPSVLQYGIFGTGPLDRTADTGTAAFTLNNSRSNSAHTRGYYSLEHGSKRAGFDLGIRVRVGYVIGATTYTKFIGRLQVATPTPGLLPQQVRCVAVDWFDAAARTKLTTIALQSNKRADELLALIVAAVTDQPTSTSFDTGHETYLLAMDEASQALTEIDKVTRSEFGFTYLKGTTTGGNILKHESRLSRLTPSAASYAFTDSNLVGLTLEPDQGGIYNSVEAITHPRTQDAAATTVLFSLQSKSLVTAGASIQISGSYTDPTQRAVRISGMDMVVPVSGTDYVMNSAADGSGSNLTANFTVTASYAGDAVFYTITNNGAVDGYITTLQARGRGVYDFQPVYSKATSSSSITAYGRQDLEIDMPYQSDTAVGTAVASFVRTRWSTVAGGTHIKVRVMGLTAALLAQVIAREPGDVVSITETTTGLNITGFINAVTLTFSEYAPVVEWVIYRAEPVGYWNLDHVGRSELGTTTRLAPL
jgi:hypothetical protein